MNAVVHLSPAYHWTCPDCGWLNYDLPVPVELTPDERRRIGCRMNRLAMRRGLAIADVRAVTFVTAPQRVTCGACAVSFRAEDEKTDDNIDE